MKIPKTIVIQFNSIYCLHYKRYAKQNYIKKNGNKVKIILKIPKTIVIQFYLLLNSICIYAFTIDANFYLTNKFTKTTDFSYSKNKNTDKKRFPWRINY